MSYKRHQENSENDFDPAAAVREIDAAHSRLSAEKATQDQEEERKEPRTPLPQPPQPSRGRSLDHEIPRVQLFDAKTGREITRGRRDVQIIDPRTGNEVSRVRGAQRPAHQEEPVHGTQQQAEEEEEEEEQEEELEEELEEEEESTSDIKAKLKKIQEMLQTGSPEKNGKSRNKGPCKCGFKHWYGGEECDLILQFPVCGKLLTFGYNVNSNPHTVAQHLITKHKLNPGSLDDTPLRNHIVTILQDHTIEYRPVENLEAHLDKKPRNQSRMTEEERQKIAEERRQTTERLRLQQKEKTRKEKEQRKRVLEKMQEDRRKTQKEKEADRRARETARQELPKRPVVKGSMLEWQQGDISTIVDATVSQEARKQKALKKHRDNQRADPKSEFRFGSYGFDSDSDGYDIMNDSSEDDFDLPPLEPHDVPTLASRHSTPSVSSSSWPSSSSRRGFHSIHDFESSGSKREWTRDDVLDMHDEQGERKLRQALRADGMSQEQIDIIIGNVDTYRLQRALAQLANNMIVDDELESKKPNLNQTNRVGSLGTADFSKQSSSSQSIKKPQYFQGRGNSLTSTTATRAAMIQPKTTEAVFQVDKSKATTRVRIKFHNGEEKEISVNLTTTIKDIRRYIDQCFFGLPRLYDLFLMGFPRKKLSDESQTVKKAGLMKAKIQQSLRR